MWTTVAFTESQDSAALANIAGLTDAHVTVSGDDIRVPPWATRIGSAYFIGPFMTQAQLTSPSIRRVVPIDWAPVDRVSAPSSPTVWLDMFDHPWELVADESLNALGAEDGAGATRETAIVWLTDGTYEAVEGAEIFTIRATATATLGAFSWTNSAIVFSNTLPAGRYQIVGARGESAGLIAFRFVLPGAGNRPGGIGQASVSRLQPDRFRTGRLGVWGTFHSNNPPTVDWLSGSADVAEVLYLDLVALA